MFCFKMSPQAVVVRQAYILFMYHAYDATFILNKTILISPLLLKYSVLFF
jgi:hypothetical protein